MGFQLKRTD